MLEPMRKLARLSGQRGKFLEAESLYRQTMSIQARIFGASHPFTVFWLEQLALFFQEQGRLEGAETALLEVYNKRNIMFGSQHEETRKVIKELMHLYNTWGKPEEVEKYRELFSPSG